MIHPIPHKLSVIVADDSVIVRKRLCQLLEEQGHVHVVGEAGTAIEAILLYRARRPDAVVLDIQMPDASGIEVLRRIKHLNPKSVVIMLTSYRDGNFREACRRAGADDYLHKATEFEQVATKLNRLAQERSGSADPSSSRRLDRPEESRQSASTQLGKES